MKGVVKIPGLDVRTQVSLTNPGVLNTFVCVTLMSLSILTEQPAVQFVPVSDSRGAATGRSVNFTA